MRATSKLMLNSFWGRFALNSNKTQCKFIHTIAEWYELIGDDKYDIKDVDFTTGDVATVYFSVKSELFVNSHQTNIVLASFVTSYARIKLLVEMEKLGDRLLYTDTDSLFFISNGTDYDPALGDYLGDLTDEIDKKDGYITTFISCGPKNYAYELSTGKQKCTIKGFSLNYNASLKLNFDSMKDIVLNDFTKKIEVEQVNFTRDKKTWDVSTSIIKKLYSFVYNKRIIVENFNTVPYGY